MNDWNRIERLSAVAVVIKPVYTETGKATEVITADGQTLRDARDVRSVLTALFRCYQIDPRAQKTAVKKLLGKQLALPFYLSPERVFIPLKMRQPRAEHDPVYGYVDLNYISGIHPAPYNRCRLVLTNGTAVDLSCTRTTAIKSWDCGTQLVKSLQPQSKKSNLRARVVEVVDAIMERLEFVCQGLEKHWD
ncbi:MAG: hypothetical protein HPY90_00025 [Syntrophothermus sp.]|uniref:hypothetical protein n=1 Tax=Syntrophothermus sp. TaxID=2736299 RepID=UPI00257B03E0|nr:hypothetical protein [Syntrophothermus sp.]NSW81652.1 hypothetical protein [Syntrophothermus sp.]